MEVESEDSKGHCPQDYPSLLTTFGFSSEGLHIVPQSNRFLKTSTSKTSRHLPEQTVGAILESVGLGGKYFLPFEPFHWSQAPLLKSTQSLDLPGWVETGGSMLKFKALTLWLAVREAWHQNKNAGLLIRNTRDSKGRGLRSSSVLEWLPSMQEAPGKNCVWGWGNATVLDLMQSLEW